MTQIEIKEKKETLNYLVNVANEYEKEHPDDRRAEYRHLVDMIDDIADELLMEGVDLYE